MTKYNLGSCQQLNQRDITAESFVKIYGRKTYNIAYYMLGEKELALSVLNQVMIKIFKCNENILNEPHNNKQLYRMIINCCREIEGKEPIGYKRSCNGMEDTINSAISMLPFDHRIALVLRDIQKLSYEEISDILELPVDVVAKNLYKGRLSIKGVLSFNRSY